MFEVFNYLILTLIGLITFFPFYQVVITSFVTFKEYLSKSVILFPSEWTLESYQFVFSTSKFFTALRNTVVITIVGTVISMAITSMMAYPLSKTNLKGQRFFSLFIIFPMLFSGGLVPYYLLVKSLHLINSIWALILPGCLGTFYIILMKNFFISLPDSLEESAKLDGANDLYILFRIVIPLSMPIIATLSLFYGVGYWNQYYNAILFINKSSLLPLQNILREILIDNSLESLSSGMSYFSSRAFETSHTIKMAIIVVATIPIICVYPLLQKHYVKGIMLGAVKG
jgi:putative aldouronate transport system permease protein